MTELEFTKKVAEDYERAGYSVVVQPDPGQLPAVFADVRVDLLARRGAETVAVEVKRRDELYDLADVSALAGRVENMPGWRLDVVVLPADETGDMPAQSTEPDPDQIQALVAEAEAGLRAGAVRSALLVAWAASEAAMREAARRGGLAVDREPPGFVLKTLFANGIVSREEYDRGQRSSRVRNALAHGYEPPAFVPADVRWLLDFSRRLLSPEAVGTGP